MNVFTRRPVLRWLVPASAAVVLAAGGGTVGLLTATAGDALPERTPAQLLVDVQRAELDGLSGTIVQNADLGLPNLPGSGGGGSSSGSGSSDLTSLVSGSHTLRLWYAGPDKVRLSLLGSLGESDVVRNGTDLWTWSSTDKSATHRAVAATEKAPGSTTDVVPLTPQQAADRALQAVSPTTQVTSGGTAEVAGRRAYELVLQPKDGAALVESVHIAVDAKTHVPTRVQVFAKGVADPSFEVGFTSVDFATPAASTFRFNPPPGTEVTESGSTAAPLGRSEASSSQDQSGHDSTTGAGSGTKVVGTGWTSVVVTHVPADKGTESAGLTRMLEALPKVSGSWGSGHLLEGKLFSALLTDDGRLVVGAVAPEVLYAALAS